MYRTPLWELDNIYRSSCLLTYVDSVTLNRGESYHKLRRAVAYAYSGRLRVKTDLEQNTWSECSRLLLHLVSGYTHKEIASLLHLPVTTVQWRYRTALQKTSRMVNPTEAIK